MVSCIYKSISEYIEFFIASETVCHSTRCFKVNLVFVMFTSEPTFYLFLEHPLQFSFVLDKRNDAVFESYVPQFLSEYVQPAVFTLYFLSVSH